MTRAERPDDAPVRQPKPSWGPGKNAALSIVAFAAIFGAFAYVERDVGMGNAAHTTVTRDIAGVVGTAVQKSRDAIVAVTDNASGPSASAGAASTVAQAAPGKSSAAEAAPVMSAAAEPTVAPPMTARSHPKHTRRAHGSSTTLAANASAASAGARTTRSSEAHRTSRSQALARTKKPTDSEPSVQPHSYTADSAHMQAASVTRAEVEGARALAKARSCAQRDQWNCVEQNASRALAIDPKNSESRALLGQAIRNRL
ncbi:hypothetical protein CH72_3556 [Burkholderia ambifaria AMMD]|uniref:Uncharacterized protein n=1 Tax=Burkholderia ambifaria (strain ATCC BAA-244 / DSM 16087 / CCUG 44356 / LMG 19182 / AMMD) TaxID=339670 RepID=Q0B9V3_BURCM|nr:hypothetical protein [Burkholderia ambifaria]ABI89070.1 conserved hypothetical protein [Burkholderia ambifaria AMMD]AJY25601.1 hypothetical protein CH72_3556 [Burkholderia ambifaria AMMD]MBR7930974.1 hypothetical protein [Burkholderia ambifaria]PEH69356.1 hypothetical protein CRM91_16175 [Burkholderia ambifaria]QQC06047.1 hypothetical protein I6H84_22605 [Burkholderia ambifaria]